MAAESRFATKVVLSRYFLPTSWLVIVVGLEPKSWITLIHVLIPLSYLLFVCADQLGFWETAHLPLF